MRYSKAILDRFAVAFQRAIENSLSSLFKNCEVNVSVVVKPSKEEDNEHPGRDKESSDGRHT